MERAKGQLLRICEALYGMAVDDIGDMGGFRFKCDSPHPPFSLPIFFAAFLDARYRDSG